MRIQTAGPVPISPSSTHPTVHFFFSPSLLVQSKQWNLKKNPRGMDHKSATSFIYFLPVAPPELCDIYPPPSAIIL